jgi:hemin uptake protein HemP
MTEAGWHRHADPPRAAEFRNGTETLAALECAAFGRDAGGDRLRRGLAVRQKSTKLEFLKHIVASTQAGPEVFSTVMTSDDYARDHVQMICESLQLGLTRLYRDRDGYGYEVRITRAGKLLAFGEIEAAAAVLDSGRGITRLAGDPPEGALGTLLAPGSKGISLYGIAARQHAPEMIRGVATGHLSVADGVIQASPLLKRSTGLGGWGDIGGLARPSRERETTLSLPSSRSTRHVSARKP